jgi:hypothetical protein
MFFSIVQYLLVLFLGGDDLSSESVVNCTKLPQCDLAILVQYCVIEGELEQRTNLSNKLGKNHQPKRSHTLLASILGKDLYSDAGDVFGVLDIEEKGD